MLRISKLADYSVVLLCQLSLAPAQRCSAKQLADATAIPAPTVSKLLKILTESSLVESARGVQGGYRLACPAADISVADVIVAIDGCLAVTECNLSDGCCALLSNCNIKANWQHINQRFYALLSGISILAMGQPLQEVANAG